MGKFIIDYDEEIDVCRVMELIFMVVGDGKISETNKGVKHYCWVTKFSDCTVITREKKEGQTSDSFIVRKNDGK